MVNKMKIDIKYKKIFITFLIYSIIGWCYEVFLEVFIYKWGFSNRGVLYGPYCPVYGFGALIFIFCFYKILKNKSKKEKVMLIPIIFIGTALSATILELITSYLCELVLGSWPWQTYLDYKFNFEGRIALSPSIRFGIGGVIFLYLFQPIIEKILNKISNKKLNIIFYLLLIIFLIDIFCSVMGWWF